MELRTWNRGRLEGRPRKWRRDCVQEWNMNDVMSGESSEGDTKASLRRQTLPIIVRHASGGQTWRRQEDWKRIIRMV